MILGIDEVGRGPWAGPLVVGAVVLGGASIDGLDDSKKLSKKRREALDIRIRAEAEGFGLGWVSAGELDTIGMSAALRLATVRAVEQVRCSYTEIIIDGTINLLEGTRKGAYVTTMPKADGLVPSVSAASIIAKVARDNYMNELAKTHPCYGFDTNAGYGVEKHRNAIDEYGVCSEHRLSFAPLAKYAPVAASKTETPPNTPVAERKPSLGQIGEDTAARYLEQKGYDILVRNWRTKWCEIDIIASDGSTVYFVEVKYRQSNDHGDGLAAITPKKIRQMTFAATLYSERLANKPDLQLAAISITGHDQPHVDSFVKIV